MRIGTPPWCPIAPAIGGRSRFPAPLPCFRSAAFGDRAAELLGVTSGPSTRIDLQHRGLASLELLLLGGQIPVPTTPPQLRAPVLGALEEHSTYPDC
jgi:hypothetical protein